MTASTTFTQAFFERYSPEAFTGAEKAFFIKSLATRTSLMLAGEGIHTFSPTAVLVSADAAGAATVAGDCDPAAAIAEACPAVTELSLAKNFLAEWGSVGQIMSGFPLLTALDVAFNAKLGELGIGGCDGCSPRFLHLHTVNLRGCGVSFECTGMQLLEGCPELKELDLSQNKLVSFEAPSTDLVSTALTTLRLDDNHFGKGSGGFISTRSWNSVSIKVFPNLKTISLNGNKHLTTIDAAALQAVGNADFCNVTNLYLSDTGM